MKGLAESYYTSLSMPRGMKIFNWRKNLGKWRYLIAVPLAVALFLFLSSLRFRKYVIQPFESIRRNEWNNILVEISVIGERDFAEF